ncbi:MAG: T9SS type A sorting domain-containing protein [Salibacteraceae bacterium]
MHIRHLLWFVVFLFFINNSIHASHVAGGVIQYKHVSGSQWYVKASIIRDCNGVQYSTNVMQLTGTCNVNGSVKTSLLNHIPFIAPAPKYGGPYSAVDVINGSTTLKVREVTIACDYVLNPNITPVSTCRDVNSSIQGFTLYEFGGFITLPTCEKWNLSAAPVCCRNNQGSNFTSSGTLLESSLNNMTFSDNSSPLFDNTTILRYDACLGVSGRFPFTQLDPDGDSLTYSLHCPYQGVNNCIVFATGYSAQSPMAGASLDSNTGVFTFKPLISGKKTFGVKVNEYDPVTKLWKGSTLIDVQFIVSACNNQQPVSKYGISNIYGNGATKIDSFKMRVKAGHLVTFEDTIYDPNVTDQIGVTSIGSNGLSNYSLVVDTLATNKIKITVSFIPSSSAGGQDLLTLKYSDSKCPVPSTTFAVYKLDVIPDLVVRGGKKSRVDTVLLMKGDTLDLTTNATGRSSWNSIIGDPFVWSGTGRNVWGDTNSIDTNSTIKFQPFNNTLVSVDGKVKAGGAFFTGSDSIYIIIIPPFNIKVSLDSNYCLRGDSSQAFVTADSNFIYSYKWSSFKGRIIGDTVWNPFLIGPNYSDFYVTVTSHYGGERVAKINLGVRNGVFYPRIVANSDTICKGSEVILKVKSGLDQNKCGTVLPQSTSDFFRTYDSLNTLSTGLGTSLFPNPLSGHRKSTKQQYLYRARDLKSAGFKSGIIQSISFYLDSNSAITSDTLFNYSIKLKCTSDSDLYAFQTAGLVEVANNKTVPLIKGWNKIEFDSSYYWSGNENLLVQVCNLNSDSIFPLIKTAMEPINYNGNVCFYDPLATCSRTNIALSNFQRIPVIEFGIKNFADTANFVYDWSAGLVQDTTVKSSALGRPQVTQTHTAIITDTVSFCKDTIEKNIVVIDPTIDLGRDTSLCEGSQFSLLAQVDSGLAGDVTWYPNGIFSNPKGFSKSLIIDSSLFIWTHFTNSYGCDLTDTIEITAKPIPTPSILTTGPFCESSKGDTLKSDILGGTFTGVGITGNVFNPNDPLLKPSLSNPKSTQITYRVIVNGCEGDTSIFVDIYPLFDTTYSGPRSFCETDSSITLTTKHQGGVWSGVGVTNNRFDPILAGIGVYPIQVDSMGFCGNSATYQFVVDKNPVKDLQTKTIGCGPYSVHLDAGNPGAKYNWNTGDTSQVIQINAIGSYWVEVTNSAQCSSTDSIRVELIKQCAGIEGNTFDNGVKIYPNPVQNILGVYQNNTQSKNLKVNLYNSLGALFYESSTSESKIQIEVSSFPSGIYYLNVENDLGISTFRIVIE